MLLQPFCVSADLENAAAAARVQYPSILAQGVRPLITNRIYQGAVDTLLLRFVLGTSPDLDAVQIIKIRTPQELTVYILMDWSPKAGGDPDFPGAGAGVFLFYGPGALNDDHFSRPMPLGSRGILIAIGGESSAPITLTSTSPSVCKVEDYPYTYADLAAASPSTVVGHSSKSNVAGFLITLVGFGWTSFYLNQDARGIYKKAVTLFGGNFLFPQLCHPASGGGAAAGGGCQYATGAGTTTHVFFVASGGAVGGGAASPNQWEWHVAEGGVRGGGAAGISKGRAYQGTGVGVAGGSAGVMRFQLQHRTISGAGGGVVGGLVRSRINGGLDYRHEAAGGGVAAGAVDYVRCETRFGRGGGVVGGKVASAELNLTPPEGAYFSALISYNTSLRYEFTPLGVPKRGGVITFEIISTIHIIGTLEILDNPASMAYTRSSKWCGLSYTNYRVVETTEDGVVARSKWYLLRLLVDYPPAINIVKYGLLSTILGYVQWSGGSDSMMVYIGGVAVNTRISLDNSYWANHFNDVDTNFNTTVFVAQQGGTWCTESSGNITIIDVVRRNASKTPNTFYVTLSSIGEPSCYNPPPQTLKWIYHTGNVYKFTGLKIINDKYSYAISFPNCSGPPTYSQQVVTYLSQTPQVVEVTVSVAIDSGCFNAGGGIQVSDNYQAQSIFSQFTSRLDGSRPCGTGTPSWVTVYSSGCTITNELFWFYDGEWHDRFDAPYYSGTLTRMSADGKKRATWGVELYAPDGFSGSAGVPKPGETSGHNAQLLLNYWGFASFASCDSIYYFWPGLGAALDEFYGVGEWDLSIIHIVSMEEYK